MKKSVQVLVLLLFLQAVVFATSDQAKYIEKYREIAVKEMQRTGIPASVKMAQAILESNSGRSKLAQKANNHFGIKCGSNWTGAKFYKEDDDYDKRGKLIESCFRKYDKEQESWFAHSEFLKKARYQHLYYLRPTDYKSWAKGLRQAGYATSPSYARDLIAIIETYGLYEYDRVSSTLPPKILKDEKIVKQTQTYPKTRTEEKLVRIEMPSHVNDVRVTYSTEGESLMNIAERSGVSATSLIKYNELLTSSSIALKKGTRVFLQMKRSYFRDRTELHQVQVGETMFDISQQYGIKLKDLHERNLLEDGDQPAVGTHIRLRGKRKEAPATRTSAQTGKVSVKISTPMLERNPSLDDEDLDENEDGLLDMEGTVALEELEVPVKEPIVENKPRVQPTIPDHVPATVVLGDEVEEFPEPRINDKQPNVVISDTSYYTVQAKDTLYGIARNHNSTVAQIRNLNGLADDTIHPNQRLRVR